ncbi:hypothetical protein HY450_00105 [Candidatus Pacearchaeota archaeon]|nr:hypothetical protein [Candidatus Pacearchaeota archaeon]
MELKELKKEYEVLKKKLDLPSFKELNEDFEIDKISKESGTLIRAIRKIVMEKIVNSLTFIEMLLNPMNAPRMYHPYIQSITSEDKERIDKIYLTLAEISIESLKCEIEYKEKKEADIIKSSFKIWQTLKPDFLAIISKIRSPNSSSQKKERNYFG